MKAHYKVNCRNYLFLLILAATSPIFLQAQIVKDSSKLLPADGSAEDFFGNAVAIENNVAVISAWFKNDLTGAVYVFRKNGENWTQEQKLVPSDDSAYDFFGESVAIYQDYIIVGATGAGNKGAAYIFKYNGNTWLQEAKLTSSDGFDYDRFGSAVSINENYAVVGADRAQVTIGAVYIFKNTGSAWVQEDKLIGPLYASAFGGAVGISGQAIIVGAPDNSYAFIYMLDGDTWVKVAELDDPDGSIYDKFGRSVSIHEDLAIVGATHHQNGNGATGAAYAYKRQGSNWIEVEKITAADGELDDHFGIVSLRGNTLIIGAYHADDYGMDAGAVYVYRNETSLSTLDSHYNELAESRSDKTNSWTFVKKVFAPDGFAGDEFGSAVAVTGDYFVAGAPNDNDNGSSSGSAYVFNLDFSIGTPNISLQSSCMLEQNNPNPFQSATTIHYALNRGGFIKMDVITPEGKLVQTLSEGFMPAGVHSVSWNGTQLQGATAPPGVYLYRLQTDQTTLYRKMLKTGP